MFTAETKADMASFILKGLVTNDAIDRLTMTVYENGIDRLRKGNQRRIIRLGRTWAKNDSSSDNPSVYKYRQADGSFIQTSYRDSPSCQTNHRG